MIYDEKLSNEVKNIINLELNKNIIITTRHSENHKRMCIVGNHQYLIEMNFKNFNEYIWLHECMHISQFEYGYPKLSYNLNCKYQTKRIVDRLQDLVLDTFLNKKLQYVYNFNFPKNDGKYFEYSNQIKMVNRSSITSDFIKLMSIETAYIYFNENKNFANKLLSQIEKKLTYDVSKIFYKIKDIFNGCIENNANNCIFCFQKLITILDLTNDCYILTDDNHQTGE